MFCQRVHRQLEPAASSVLLRLLVRYLVELEALDVTLFTKSQAHCFASTVDVRGSMMMLCYLSMLTVYVCSRIGHQSVYVEECTVLV